jgi:hypothetical protein|tara:strand:+ start:226 stop:342 length:117 start_codon:yes stop_codon:yes gene_type:complete
VFLPEDPNSLPDDPPDLVFLLFHIKYKTPATNNKPIID